MFGRSRKVRIFVATICCGKMVLVWYPFKVTKHYKNRGFCEKQSEIFDPILSSLSVSLMTWSDDVVVLLSILYGSYHCGHPRHCVVVAPFSLCHLSRGSDHSSQSLFLLQTVVMIVTHTMTYHSSSDSCRCRLLVLLSSPCSHSPSDCCHCSHRRSAGPLLLLFSLSQDVAVW